MALDGAQAANLTLVLNSVLEESTREAYGVAQGLPKLKSLICYLKDSFNSDKNNILDPSAAQIVAWRLEKVTFPFRREAILTSEPREVTTPETVQPGGEYSGIFKLVSFFQDPYDGWFRQEGTAFAISDFDALTAAHNVWHPELGPAKMVALLMDQRGDVNDRYARHCVATAVHARWTASRSRSTDFSMITVAQSFGPSVHTHQYDTTPEVPETPGSVGYVLGFPYDFPRGFPGKHLIKSRGQISYHGDGDKGTIMHMANTELGNSGGPIFNPDNIAIGVHIGCNRFRTKLAQAASSSTQKRVSFKKQNRSSLKRPRNAKDETHQQRRCPSQCKANETSYIINQAAPLNRDGNMVASFLAVQRYMTAGTLPDDCVQCLDEIWNAGAQVMLHRFG